MMIEQSTATALQSGLQTYEKSSTQGAGSTDRTTNSSQQQIEQPSQSSPDVVTNFSAAGLEASRTLTQPAGVAAQDRTEERMGESELRESQLKQQQEMRSQGEQQQSGRIDIKA